MQKAGCGMKWIVVGALLLVVLVAGAVLPRKSVHAELIIEAAPSEVWRQITDTASYGEWNPIFVSVAGVFREGAKIQLDMRTEDGSTVPVEAFVEEFVPEQKLHQHAGMTGVLTADHFWLVEPVPQGTRVVQHEEYRGIGVLFWDPGYVQTLYEEGLAVLKIRLEGVNP